MVAPLTLLRKAEGTQSKGRVVLSGLVEQRGQQHTHYKGRDTPKDTPARLVTPQPILTAKPRSNCPWTSSTLVRAIGST